jgi:xanthine dehydrogenase accessory factor
MKDLMTMARVIREMPGKTLVLATVIRVEGSAYRQPGARLLMDPASSQSWGMVSGGCLESDLMEHARAVLQSGVAKMVRYDSMNPADLVIGTGSGCQGIIEISVKPLPTRVGERFAGFIEGIWRDRIPGILSTVVRDSAEPKLNDEGLEVHLSNDNLPECFRNVFEPWAPDCKNVVRKIGEQLYEFLAEQIIPPVHLVIFGAGQDVMPIPSLARQLGWKTTVVDVRGRSDMAERFPDVDQVLTGSPEAALEQMCVDPRTAFVVMNHHLEHDRESLREILRTGARYIGMLGPRRRSGRILEELEKTGVALSAEQLFSIHGPVGLDIGAKSQEEIALAILAEVQMKMSVSHQTTAVSLREMVP